jgi:hypothetical protein
MIEECSRLTQSAEYRNARNLPFVVITRRVMTTTVAGVRSGSQALIQAQGPSHNKLSILIQSTVILAGITS